MYMYVMAAVKTAKVLKAAKIAKAVGPVFIATQRVVDENKRKKQQLG